MSATVETRADRDEAVYGRLFREGRGEVLARMAREFPDVSPQDREDTASLALLDMIRARRLTRWEPGAIGLWAEMARRRMANKFVHDRRREQHARLEPLTEEVEVVGSVTPHEEIEAALSDWRAVELMAQLSPRAATFVRMRVLEGSARADVMAATGWSGKQYEKAQSAAKAALRSALGDLDSPRRCGQYRRLIDRRTLGVELDKRKQVELHAHLERCGSCRAYGSEAHRAVRGVAPLLGLVPAGAVVGGAVAGGGAVGIGVSAGIVAKGAVVLCAGVLCVGGTYLALHGGDGGRRRVPHASASLKTTLPSAVVAHRPAVVALRSGRKGESHGRSDPLVLGGGASQASVRPVSGLDPVPPARHSSADAESVFGLGASAPAPAAPSAACAPGELGC